MTGRSLLERVTGSLIKGIRRNRPIRPTVPGSPASRIVIRSILRNRVLGSPTPRRSGFEILIGERCLSGGLARKEPA
jgi:hypothetical protein